MEGQVAGQGPVKARQAPNEQVQVKVSEAVRQAQALLDQNKIDAAEKLALAILNRRPNQPQTVQILAAIAERRGEPGRAIQILRNSLIGKDSDALSLMNLCRAFRTVGRLQDSRTAGEASVAIGTVPDAMADLADTYVAIGDNDLALKTFEKAVALRPNLPRARLGLAHALMMKGEFAPGWVEYEWRYKLAATRDLLPKFKQPQWNGMRLSESRLLVICEQGFGDCIQYARYLPMVAERVKDVVIGCGPELTTLIGRVSGGRHRVYDRWEHLPAFQYQITLSSLPMVFGTTLDTIPNSIPYMTAPPDKAALWRERLEKAAAGRKTVGVVWQGRPTHPNDRLRSVGLGPLTRLLEIDDVLPVSLQLGPGRDQLLQHPLRARVFDPTAELKDFSDTAAIIESLDCVVSIDSAIAHLTGALGRPGFVMLPFAGEWRWLEKRSDSPWYSTLELVRQDESRTWDSVVQRIGERLRAL